MLFVCQYSLLNLANKCLEPGFRLHVRAHNTLASVFSLTHDAPQDPVTYCDLLIIKRCNVLKIRRCLHPPHLPFKNLVRETEYPSSPFKNASS